MVLIFHIFLFVYLWSQCRTLEDSTTLEASWLKSLALQVQDEETVKVKSKVENNQRKWILEIFEEAKNNFTLRNDVTEDCKKDFKTYELFLKNQTIWAIRMMESSEWPHMSVFAGLTTSLGNWDECLRSQGPVHIQGQYCLVDATYDYNFAIAAPKQDGWDDWPAENVSAWQIMKMYETIATRKSRRDLTWAMCIPSSCQPSDLQTALSSVLKPAFERYDMIIDVAVDPIKCRIREENIYPLSFIFTLLFILCLVMVVGFSTLHHLLISQLANSKKSEEDGEEESTVMKTFGCFSGVKSWNVLWRDSNSTIGIIYTTKVLSFIIIIIAHEGMLSYPFPKLEEEEAELIYKPFKLGLGFHGVVDIFLMTSGYLTFHFGITRVKNYGATYVICSIVFRWLRLIPVMSLVILFLVNVMPYLGDGPLFSTNFLNEVQYCTANWWTNILAVNNLVNRNDMCLLPTWYVAVDFQLSILGGLLLVVLSRNYKAGIYLILLTIVAGMSISAYKIATEQLSGIPMPVILALDLMRKWPAFTDNYIQIFSRTGPYFTGCLFALLLNKLREWKWKPSVTTALFWIIISGVGWLLQAYGFLLFRLNRPYITVEHILYGVTHRIFMVIPSATFYVMLSLQKITIVSDVFEWKVFMPLGRLSYCVYLFSLPIQMFHLATNRQILSGATNMDLFWRCNSNILVSIIFATILYFLSEGPINSLLSLLQGSIISKLKKSNNFPAHQESLKTVTL